MAIPFRACASVCGGHAAAPATFTLRLTAVMLVMEARGADESNSPKRVSGAGHHGTRGSGNGHHISKPLLVVYINMIDVGE